MLPKKGSLLRIFIGESDRYHHKPLYEWIVQKARELDLAGTTVTRGIEGFGASSRLHTAKLLRLSADLPIVIEIIDQTEKIEEFLSQIDQALTGGIATVESVDIRYYKATENSENKPQ